MEHRRCVSAGEQSGIAERECDECRWVDIGNECSCVTPVAGVSLDRSPHSDSTRVSRMIADGSGGMLGGLGPASALCTLSAFCPDWPSFRDKKGPFVVDIRVDSLTMSVLLLSEPERTGLISQRAGTTTISSRGTLHSCSEVDDGGPKFGEESMYDLNRMAMKQSADNRPVPNVNIAST